MSLPHSCICDRRWGGQHTAHCATCHETFSGVTTFDAHRRSAAGTRGCVHPSEIGMKLTSRGGYQVWIGAGTSPWADADEDTLGEVPAAA